MPQNDSMDNTNSDTLTFVVKALRQHEKRMDHLISKLDTKKDELLTGTKKLNVDVEEITKKLDAIRNEIEKLKTILLT